MKRTPKAEAQRKVTLAETMYAKLVEKNRKAEADYREKIERLKAEYVAVEDTDAGLEVGLTNGQYRDELGHIRDKTGMWQE